MVTLDKQSPDIAQGVDTSLEVQTGTSGEDILSAQGAGDQGMMFGYACDETEDLMPLPIWWSHRLAERLSAVRKDGTLPYLRPDGKTQTTVRYEDGAPVELLTVLISTQHSDDVEREQIQADLEHHVITPLIPANFAGSDAVGSREPDGQVRPRRPARRHAASPVARSSLTPTAARPVTVVARSRARTRPRSTARPPTRRVGWPSTSWPPGAAKRCEVQVAYAIGRAEPVSLLVETFGTATVDPDKIDRVVRDLFDLRPAAIVRDLDLRRPVYKATAAYGHFGRNGRRLHVGGHAAGRRPEVRPRSVTRAAASSKSSRTSRRSTAPLTTRYPTSSTRAVARRLRRPDRPARSPRPGLGHRRRRRLR